MFPLAELLIALHGQKLGAGWVGWRKQTEGKQAQFQVRFLKM